jgi:hypothetical protein
MGLFSNHSRAGRNNLIGNHYPSAIDGAAFIRDNSTVIEEQYISGCMQSKYN